MKVLLVNGSPHTKGCTYTALCEVEKELIANGIETEIIQLGTKPIGGCMGCGACASLGKCVQNDILNEVIEKFKEADGYVFGSPVHYAAPSGTMVSFMDRLFYSCGSSMAFKPAACVVSARRAGTTAAYDQLNKYIGINNMIMVPAPYWNMVHGSKAEDVLEDGEGLQIMRMIGKNMSWLLKLIESGKESGLVHPETEAKVRTNFIR